MQIIFGLCIETKWIEVSLYCRLAALYSALLRDNGRVDTDVSESFISRRECHYAPLVLMFIFRIPHPCKCQFMQSGALVCTAFGGARRAWRLASVRMLRLKMWLKLLSVAGCFGWMKRSFLAGNFICSEAQSSSLKRFRRNDFFFFLARRNSETVEMADNQGQCIWTRELQRNYSAICCQNMRDVQRI